MFLNVANAIFKFRFLVYPLRKRKLEELEGDCFQDNVGLKPLEKSYVQPPTNCHSK